MFRNAVKTGLLFLLIGVAVSFAVPPLLTAFAGMHLAGTVGAWATAAATKYGAIAAANVIDTALVFGGFGVFQTLLGPMFNAIFDKKPGIRTCKRCRKSTVARQRKGNSA